MILRISFHLKGTLHDLTPPFAQRRTVMHRIEPHDRLFPVSRRALTPRAEAHDLCAGDGKVDIEGNNELVNRYDIVIVRRCIIAKTQLKRHLKIQLFVLARVQIVFHNLLPLSDNFLILNHLYRCIIRQFHHHTILHRRHVQRMHIIPIIQPFEIPPSLDENCAHVREHGPGHGRHEGIPRRHDRRKHGLEEESVSHPFTHDDVHGLPVGQWKALRFDEGFDLTTHARHDILESVQLDDLLCLVDDVAVVHGNHLLGTCLGAE
mmetsp:Transcript_9022/g.19069  ORF Transcript_9022/g.19069 Transcript_9022/m.19069 type:complete len:263 (+) Transcript_9022:161-949(+)